MVPTTVQGASGSAGAGTGASLGTIAALGAGERRLEDVPEARGDAEVGSPLSACEAPRTTLTISPTIPMPTKSPATATAGRNQGGREPEMRRNASTSLSGPLRGNRVSSMSPVMGPADGGPYGPWPTAS